MRRQLQEGGVKRAAREFEGQHCNLGRDKSDVKSQVFLVIPGLASYNPGIRVPMPICQRLQIYGRHAFNACTRVPQ